MWSQITKPSQFLKFWLEQATKYLQNPQQVQTFFHYYASYQKHFPDRLQFYYDRQLEEVLALIKARPSAKVLEIGCGTGTESLWLALSGAHVVALELKQDRLDVAQARKNIVEELWQQKLECHFQKKSFLDLELENYFDIIWMEQAFHHLEPREQVVRKIASVLKPGGQVIISEPNAANPLVQIRFFQRRGFKTVTEYVDNAGVSHPYGNERILGGGKLARLLSKAGIKKISVNYFRLFPNHRAFDGWLAIEKNLPKIFIPCFTHYNYVGEKIVSSH